MAAMTRAPRPPGAARRDRLLWLLLPVSTAVVIGLAALASAFWTGRTTVRVPASVNVGPGSMASTPSVAPPAAPPATSAPTTAVTGPPASETTTSTLAAAVIPPDRPVVQQTAPESPEGSGGRTDSSKGGDG